MHDPNGVTRTGYELILNFYRYPYSSKTYMKNLGLRGNVRTLRGQKTKVSGYFCHYILNNMTTEKTR